MNRLEISYDKIQHCVVNKYPQDVSLALDCPQTGAGREFSPTNLVGAGLAGCMLLSMGAVANKESIDIAGTKVEINMDMTANRIGEIILDFSMPMKYSRRESDKLEASISLCPIYSSFHPDTKITVNFNYPN